MDKITFRNGQAPYINDTNLNLMQTNIENAINEIVEKDTNENGTYIKYSNGIMICFGSKTYSNQTFTDDFWSDYNRSSNSLMSATFPEEFASVPICTITGRCNNAWLIVENAATKTRTQQVVAISPKNVNWNMDVVIDYIAIGTWEQENEEVSN